MPIRIFVDSDVIISSLISRTGAAYLLMHDERIARFISDVSLLELSRVASTLHISQKNLKSLVQKTCNTIVIARGKEGTVTRMTLYSPDPNDVHIILGAKQAKAKFLVTYNTKHFLVEKIREDFGIIVFTPAFLLQYLRSLN